MSGSAKWVPEDTPHLVIDSAKMKRNILKMAKVAKRSGVALRPHVKTHKVPDIARKQVEAGAVGITVAKLSEAEVMADAGIKDIFIAYPLVTEEKIQRAIVLRKRIKLIIGAAGLCRRRERGAHSGSQAGGGYRAQEIRGPL